MAIVRSSHFLLMLLAILVPLAGAERDHAVEEGGAWLTVVQGKVPGAPALRIHSMEAPFELKDTLKPNSHIQSAARFHRA